MDGLIVNPNIEGRAARFSAWIRTSVVHSYGVGAVMVAATLGAAKGATVVAGGGAGLVSAFVVGFVMLWVAMLVECDEFSVRTGGLGEYFSIATKIGGRRYEAEVLPHVEAIERTEAVLAHLERCCDSLAEVTVSSVAASSAVRAAREVAWRAACRRRCAMQCVPTDWGAPGVGDAAAKIDEHTLAAERLEAELDTLLASVESALAAAADTTQVHLDAEGLTRDERAVVEGSGFAQAELGVVAASYDALHPTRDAQAIMASAPSTQPGTSPR